MGAREIFVQNVNAGNWEAATDQLNGSPMYDILPFLAALGGNMAISANNISGLLRRRGWFGAAQRIEWAGEVVRTRRVPNPPPGFPGDQVTDAQRFLAQHASPQGHAFDIEMSSPFVSGWQGGLGGPNLGTHHGGDWYIRFGMDLGVTEGTDVLAAFSGHVTRFTPHNPATDSSKVYGAQLAMRADNDKMGGFYTHFTGGPHFSIGQRINRGDRLGRTLRDHLHLALVEIIGGAPSGRYMGVDLYQNFLHIRDTRSTLTVTFRQNGSPPGVVE
jgi:murein DD-endopeptidase MepM/ murein hydrolase activator NlpD